MTIGYMLSCFCDGNAEENAYLLACFCLGYKNLIGTHK